MKKPILLLIITALLFSANLMMAQSTDSEYKTLFNSKDFTYSGWGAFEMKAGHIDGVADFAPFVGGKGGLMINKRFTIGLAGYSLLPVIERYESVIPLDQWDDILFVGYGGLYLEYIFLPNNAINFNVNCIIGGGAAAYYDGYNRYGNYIEKATILFVAEPGVNIGFNITEWFKIDVGASYRIAENVYDAYIIDYKNLSGISGNIAFKFGKFK